MRHFGNGRARGGGKAENVRLCSRLTPSDVQFSALLLASQFMTVPGVVARDPANEGLLPVGG